MNARRSVGRDCFPIVRLRYGRAAASRGLPVVLYRQFFVERTCLRRFAGAAYDG